MRVYACVCKCQSVDLRIVLQYHVVGLTRTSLCLRICEFSKYMKPHFVFIELTEKYNEYEKVVEDDRVRKEKQARAAQQVIYIYIYKEKKKEIEKERKRKTACKREREREIDGEYECVLINRLLLHIYSIIVSPPPLSSSSF